MKHFISVILVIFFVQLSIAQSKYEKMKAFKTAYLTEKLELTPKEAEKFWPVYNESENELRALRKQNKQIVLETKESIDAVNGAEMKDPDKILGQLLANDREMQKKKENLFKDLKGILSEEKLLKLYVAEAEFNKHLLKEYRKRGPGRP